MNSILLVSHISLFYKLTPSWLFTNRSHNLNNNSKTNTNKLNIFHELKGLTNQCFLTLIDLIQTSLNFVYKNYFSFGYNFLKFNFSIHWLALRIPESTWPRPFDFRYVYMYTHTHTHTHTHTYRKRVGRKFL